MGYLAAREYGTLFVENRYTDFGNYYPHRTLRNLWMLARYVPCLLYTSHVQRGCCAVREIDGHRLVVHHCVLAVPHAAAVDVIR